MGLPLNLHGTRVVCPHAYLYACGAPPNALNAGLETSRKKRCVLVFFCISKRSRPTGVPPQSRWNGGGLIPIEMRLKKDSNQGEVVVVGALVVALVGSDRGGGLQRDPTAAEQADGGGLAQRETFERPAELQTTSVMKRGRKTKGAAGVSRRKLQLLFCIRAPPRHCLPALKN